MRPTLPSQGERHLLLVRYLLLNAVLGIAFGVAVSSLLVFFDVGGIRELIEGDRRPYLVLFLFHVLWSLTGAGLFVSSAVIALPSEPQKTHDEADDA